MLGKVFRTFVGKQLVPGLNCVIKSYQLFHYSYFIPLLYVFFGNAGCRKEKQAIVFMPPSS